LLDNEVSSENYKTLRIIRILTDFVILRYFN